MRKCERWFFYLDGSSDKRLTSSTVIPVVSSLRFRAGRCSDSSRRSTSLGELLGKPGAVDFPSLLGIEYFERSVKRRIAAMLHAAMFSNNQRDRRARDEPERVW